LNHWQPGRYPCRCNTLCILKAIKIAIEVFVGTTVHVLVGVDIVGGVGDGVPCALTVVLRLEGVVEALAAMQSIMTKLGADLTVGLLATTPVTATTTATTWATTGTTAVVIDLV
jgi:hypothetical protein